MQTARARHRAQSASVLWSAPAIAPPEPQRAVGRDAPAATHEKPPTPPPTRAMQPRQLQVPPRGAEQDHCNADEYLQHLDQQSAWEEASPGLRLLSFAAPEGLHSPQSCRLGNRLQGASGCSLRGRLRPCGRRRGPLGTPWGPQVLSRSFPFLPLPFPLPLSGRPRHPIGLFPHRTTYAHKVRRFENKTPARMGLATEAISRLRL